MKTCTVAEDESRKKRGLRRRKEGKKQKEPASARKSTIQRSAPEPGMENLELDWMQGLSSRLSAYTIGPEDEPAATPTADDPPSVDDAPRA